MSIADNRIRVLLIIPRLGTGGSERVAFLLLKNLNRSIFDVAVLSLYEYSGLPYEKDAIKYDLNVFYLSKKLGFDWKIFFEVERFFRKWQPHVVQNHLYHLYAVLPACVRHRTPVCLHRFSNVVDKELSHPVLQMVYSAAFRYFNFYPVAISEQVLRSGIDVLGKIDMPIIFSGVDVSLFAPNSEIRKSWRDENSISSETIVFVSVARFAPQKNHRLMIRAFADVVSSFADSVLLLAGDGPLLPDMRLLADKYGLSNKIRFLGVIKDIAVLLNAGDVFILSSDWEGVPISVLEAMSTGKPIISTNVGGVPEIIEHEANGFLVDSGSKDKLASAMLTICHNRSIIKRWGARSRQVAVSRFDVRRMVDEYSELYLRMLKKNMAAER